MGMTQETLQQHLATCTLLGANVRIASNKEPAERLSLCRGHDQLVSEFSEQNLKTDP